VHRRAFQLAIGFALFDVIAFVVLKLAFAHPDQNFDPAVFPIHRKRDQGVAFDGSDAKKFSDFGFVQEQFTRRFGKVTENVGLGVLANVHVIQPNFVLLDAREGVTDLGFAGAKRFNFGAFKHEAGFECLRDEEIVAGLRIVEDFRHGAPLLGIADYFLEERFFGATWISSSA
jgi:hypothetical protein